MDSPDPAKQIVRVSIFNQTYPITTSGSPAEVEELARRVDELMSSIARRAGNLDTTRTAVLACLHLADQLRSAERELDALRDSVTRRTRNFATLLDEAFAANSGNNQL
jgi:cell division protein ZapA